jgi:hypothetical protein
MKQPTNFTKSLGTLRINRKTKLKSPDLTGIAKIHRRLITSLWNEINESGGDEVLCNLAAWQYQDTSGVLLRVEISERQSDRRPENIFDFDCQTKGRGQRLKLLNQQRPDQLTAFRLPTTLLQTVDSFCQERDLTRSQFFRRCVVQFINNQGIEDRAALPQR